MALPKEQQQLLWQPSPPRDPNRVSILTKLSTDIRSLIFEHILILPKPLSKKPRFGRCDWTPPLIRVFETCKQLHAEAAYVFYTRNTFNHIDAFGTTNGDFTSTVPNRVLDIYAPSLRRVNIDVKYWKELSTQRKLKKHEMWGVGKGSGYALENLRVVTEAWPNLQVITVRLSGEVFRGCSWAIAEVYGCDADVTGEKVAEEVKATWTMVKEHVAGSQVRLVVVAKHADTPVPEHADVVRLFTKALAEVGVDLRWECGSSSACLTRSPAEEWFGT